MEMFDFIVVGGGPGGCVVASRLSEIPDVTVALIEAGPDRRGLLGDCTALGSLILGTRKSSNNWALSSTPQAGLNGRSDYHPIGRGLGGGSSINVLMYLRGNRADYDSWAAMGNPGWSYDDVLPYFRKAENNQTHHDGFHGNSGPLWVEELRTDNPYHSIVKRACTEAGLPYNPDLNGLEQEGFSSTQVMMKNGERFHTGKAYIHPHLGVRKNLNLICDTHCTRILFEGKRAVGVEVINNGVRRQLHARREVIISAGGILSAKLLQLSGVGAGSALQALGIPLVHDLAAVGKNLMDHLDVTLGYHIPGDPNLVGMSPRGLLGLAKAVANYRQKRRGMGVTNFAELTGFLRVNKASISPEIQYEFVIGLAMDHGRKIIPKHGISAHILLLHPKSRGSVKLASKDFQQDPLIDFSYLSNPDDLPLLLQGVKRIASVFSTPTFKPLVKRDLFTAHCKKDEDWIEFIRNTAGTNYHPVGSCKMGSDGVVDERLRVHGLQGLRIADCSIMPAITGGNTTAPTVMIGEKAADMIKQDYRLIASI